MEVILAKEMGFCWGVKRALELAEKAAAQHGQVHTLGPLVHNDQVAKRLEGLGVHAAENVAEVAGGVVAITSHGAPPQVAEEAYRRGLTVVDTTCPFVRRVQRLAREMAEDGYTVYVFGDEGHSEVVGIVGWSGGRARIISSAGQIDPDARKIGLLSQTTKNLDAYRHLAMEVLRRSLGNCLEVRVHNTICDATLKRQEAAALLAGQAEVIIVVGSAKSANTRRLVELCSAQGVPTYRIEEAGEIDFAWLRDKKKVGVTAGASTPDWIVGPVVDTLRKL
jgi:4-hydroxy-3-methylbut-2-enyl diphosphate reductase